jgi:hypothetical protein
MELMNWRACKIPPCVNDVEAEVIAMRFGEELVLVVDQIDPEAAESHRSSCSHHLKRFSAQFFRDGWTALNGFKALQTCWIKIHRKIKDPGERLDAQKRCQTKN